MSAGEQRGCKPCADVQRNRAALLSAPGVFRPERPAASPSPSPADFEEARRAAMRLVDDTGYDAGMLADSWRQQPNSPASCTELTLDELPVALAAADRVKDARIRDSVPERLAALPATATLEDVVEIDRAAHR